MLKNKKFIFLDLGLISYEEALAIQKQKVEEIVEIKKQNKLSEEKKQTPNYVFFVEHPHTYTLGRSGVASHLLVKETFLAQMGACFYKSERGGDITYHGPGQLVVYPILDLSNFKEDLHYYLRNLEEVIIRVLAFYKLKSIRIKGQSGVWMEKKQERKICAVGIKVSSWVSSHGLALNVKTDLNYFSHIIPCGIADKGVTSLEKELDRKVSIKNVKKLIEEKFREVFV